MSSKRWKLKRTTQCRKCPHRAENAAVRPPKGYRVSHATIAEPGSLQAVFQAPMLVMSCHETRGAHCVGWLAQQLAAGGSPALRLHLRNCSNVRDITLIGDQVEKVGDGS